MIQYKCPECRLVLNKSSYYPEGYQCAHIYLTSADGRINSAHFYKNYNGRDFSIKINLVGKTTEFLINRQTVISLTYDMPVNIDYDGTIRFDLILKRMQALVLFS